MYISTTLWMIRIPARVWSLLSRVPETRQVIITTQEVDLLGRIGATEGFVRLAEEEA